MGPYGSSSSAGPDLEITLKRFRIAADGVWLADGVRTIR
jgi:hypothetical protein